jgi:LmbE family N-acetylglucosaminyl deacetylase
VNRLFDGESFSRVLAIGAHPDDVELGAGGLVARLTRAGKRVMMVVVSAPTETGERIIEAHRAAGLLGAEVQLLFGAEPIRVEDVPMHQLVKRLDGVLASEQPDLVITHSSRDLHWDHRLVHQATLSSLRRTPCDLLAFTSTPELNASSNFLGQGFADITDSLEVKLAAVSAHATQVSKGSVDVESCRDLARALGRLSGVRYAEAYEVLRLRL